MPANIDSMGYVGATPWHGEGNKLAAPPGSVEEMIRACGLEWTVSRYQLGFYLNGQKTPVDRWAVVRNDRGTVLGDVGKTYHPIQNADAFSVLQPFVDAGHVSFETGGALCGGSRVWMLAKLNRDPMEVVKGDAVEKFFTVANGHDGSMALRVGFTPVRIVCANTLAAALSKGASRLLAIRHTKDAKDALADVAAIVNFMDESFEATAEQYRALARKGVDAADLKEYVNLVFPAPKASARRDAADKARAIRGADVLATPEITPATSAIDGIMAAHYEPKQAVTIDELIEETEADRDRRSISKVIELFESGPNSLPGVRGTLWAAYNAVTEFTSHQRGKDDEARVKSLLGGEAEQINRRALQIATRMVAA